MLVCVAQRIKSCDPCFNSKNLVYFLKYHKILCHQHFFPSVMLSSLCLSPSVSTQSNWLGTSNPHTDTHTHVLPWLTDQSILRPLGKSQAGHYIKKQQSPLFLTFFWIKATLKLHNTCLYVRMRNWVCVHCIIFNVSLWLGLFTDPTTNNVCHLCLTDMWFKKISSI